MRGGNQSEDSFEISRRIFTQSAILRLFAKSRWAANELTARKVLDPLTSAWIRVTRRGSSIRRTPFSKHDSVFGSFGCSWRRGGVSFSESSSTTAMRLYGTAIILSELAPMYLGTVFRPMFNVSLSGSMTTSAQYLLSMVYEAARIDVSDGRTLSQRFCRWDLRPVAATLSSHKKAMWLHWRGWGYQKQAQAAG